MSVLKHTPEDKAMGEILKGREPEKRVLIRGGLDIDKKDTTEENARKERIAKILQSARMPVWCPECEHPMKHRLDRKFWTLHGKCFNCVIVEQTQMRAEGKWDEYEQQRLDANRISYLLDLEQFLEEVLVGLKNPEFATEIGTIERWEGVDLDVVKGDVKKQLEEVKNIIKEIRNVTGSESESEREV